jgi:hypothetical protein
MLSFNDEAFAEKIALSYTALFVFVGASPFIGSPLSRTEAIRIADAEAQRQKHVDFLDYEHWPVFCTATKGSWYVGVPKKGQRFVDFGVDVSDKTKQGRIYIFD